MFNFVTERKLNAEVENLKFDIKQLQERHWALSKRHYALMSFLGLIEDEIQAKLEIKKKGGPEASTS